MCYFRLYYAKVRKFHHIISTDQDVRRLDVAVDDLQAVQMIDCMEQLTEISARMSE